MAEGLPERLSQHFSHLLRESRHFIEGVLSVLEETVAKEPIKAVPVVPGILLELVMDTHASTYPALTSIFRGVAFSIFGRERRKTPSTRLASIFSWSITLDSENWR